MIVENVITKDLIVEDGLFSVENSQESFDANIESVIVSELEKTQAPFIRFFTNGGRLIWDAEISYDKNNKKILKVYQVVTKREDLPIVAKNNNDILILEKNLGLEHGFGGGTLWNPVRKTTEY